MKALKFQNYEKLNVTGARNKVIKLVVEWLQVETNYQKGFSVIIKQNLSYAHFKQL